MKMPLEMKNKWWIEMEYQSSWNIIRLAQVRFQNLNKIVKIMNISLEAKNKCWIAMWYQPSYNEIECWTIFPLIEEEEYGGRANAVL